MDRHEGISCSQPSPLIRARAPRAGEVGHPLRIGRADALWVEGRVVTIPRTTEDTPAEVTTLVEGIESPQHLLAVGDRLLVTDHEQGTILSINPT